MILMFRNCPWVGALTYILKAIPYQRAFIL